MFEVVNDAFYPIIRISNNLVDIIGANQYEKMINIIFNSFKY